jgi:hypothetical protein
MTRCGERNEGKFTWWMRGERLDCDYEHLCLLLCPPLQRLFARKEELAVFIVQHASSGPTSSCPSPAAACMHDVLEFNSTFCLPSRRRTAKKKSLNMVLRVFPFFMCFHLSQVRSLWAKSPAEASMSSRRGFSRGAVTSSPLRAQQLTDGDKGRRSKVSSCRESWSDSSCLSCQESILVRGTRMGEWGRPGSGISRG